MNHTLLLNSWQSPCLDLEQIIEDSYSTQENPLSPTPSGWMVLMIVLWGGEEKVDNGHLQGLRMEGDWEWMEDVMNDDHGAFCDIRFFISRGLPSISSPLPVSVNRTAPILSTNDNKRKLLQDCKLNIPANAFDCECVWGLENPAGGLNN